MSRYCLTVSEFSGRSPGSGTASTQRKTIILDQTCDSCNMFSVFCQSSKEIKLYGSKIATQRVISTDKAHPNPWGKFCSYSGQKLNPHITWAIGSWNHGAMMYNETSFTLGIDINKRCIPTACHQRYNEILFEDLWRIQQQCNLPPGLLCSSIPAADSRCSFPALGSSCPFQLTAGDTLTCLLGQHPYLSTLSTSQY